MTARAARACRHIPQYESGGLFWYSCVPRLLFGLTASNVILVGYFVAQNAVQTPISIYEYADGG